MDSCCNTVFMFATIWEGVWGWGVRVDQTVELATPGSEVVGSVPILAASPYWLGRC